MKRHSPMIGGCKSEVSPLALTRGFTLLELVVVISILTLLLGMGVGAYIRLGQSLKREAAGAKIENALRQARNFATLTGSTATVEIDRSAGSLTPTGFRVVGLWHLEDSSGAFGRDLKVESAEYDTGKIGSCLFFEGRGSFAHVESTPDIERLEGVYVEGWVCPELSGQEQYIFRKKNAFNLKLTRNGTLEGGTRKDRAETADYYLPLLRWSKVSLLISRSRIEILVDGIPRGAAEAVEPIKRNTEPFQISDPLNPFVGRIDEVRLLSQSRGQPAVLGREFALVGGPDSIHFDSRGGLDVAFHGGEVKLGYEYDNKLHTLVIGRSGMVRDRRSGPVPKAAPKPAASPAKAGG